MKLIINDCYDIQFIKYLINFLKDYLIMHSHSPKLIQLNKYLNSNSKYKSKFRRDLRCQDIIQIGAYNLKYKKYGEGHYEITIDENQKLFGLNAKLYDLCKLINYGTMDINGYSVFTNAFKYVENNLQGLEFMYLRGI